MAEQPWFYFYKSRGQRRLVPASRAGWLLIAAYVLATLVPGLLMLLIQEVWALWVFLPWLAVSLIAFLWLALRNSETIPVDEAVDLWRAQKRDRVRNRRP